MFSGVFFRRDNWKIKKKSNSLCFVNRYILQEFPVYSITFEKIKNTKSVRAIIDILYD